MSVATVTFCRSFFPLFDTLVDVKYPGLGLHLLILLVSDLSIYQLNLVSSF